MLIFRRLFLLFFLSEIKKKKDYFMIHSTNLDYDRRSNSNYHPRKVIVHINLMKLRSLFKIQNFLYQRNESHLIFVKQKCCVCCISLVRLWRLHTQTVPANNKSRTCKIFIREHRSDRQSIEKFPWVPLLLSYFLIKKVFTYA